MTPDHLQQWNEDQISELIEVTRQQGTQIGQNGVQIVALTAEIKTLSTEQTKIVRWLLMVVCAIALGKSLLEAVQAVWGKSLPSTAQAAFK